MLLLNEIGIAWPCLLVRPMSVLAPRYALIRDTGGWGTWSDAQARCTSNWHYIAFIAKHGSSAAPAIDNAVYGLMGCRNMTPMRPLVQY